MERAFKFGASSIRADEPSKLALAPLPEVLATSLFSQDKGKAAASASRRMPPRQPLATYAVMP